MVKKVIQNCDELCGACRNGGAYYSSLCTRIKSTITKNEETLYRGRYA